MKLTTITKLFMALSLVCSFLAYGNGQGSTPNGKPFIQIHTEIDDLQAQIDELVGNVGSLEERVAGLEGAVVDIQAHTDDLDAQIQVLAVDVEKNEAEILALAEQIVKNQNLINLLQDQILHIEAELAQKQNIVTGTCAEGSSLSQINADGSVICNAAVIAGLNRFTVTNFVVIPKGSYTETSCNYSWGRTTCNQYSVEDPQTRTASVSCPDGSMLISGSASADGLTLHSQGENTVGTWTAEATNYSSDEHYLFVSAICVGVQS